MSRKPPPLTDTQKQALELARRQGGKLFKNAAAWGPETFNARSTPFVDLYAFATVRGLVTRGAMEWSNYRGKSPTQARVIP
jgi:hypothetical protein